MTLKQLYQIILDRYSNYIGFHFQKRNSNKINLIHKHIRATKEENIKYLHSREYWESVFKLTTIDTAYTEFLNPLCYFETAMSLRKVNISKLKKSNGLHVEFANPVKC